MALSRKRRGFTSDELETFKGVSESTTYPYLSPLFATKVVEKLAQQNPMFYHPRFVRTNFQTIQTLINGEQFLIMFSIMLKAMKNYSKKELDLLIK